MTAVNARSDLQPRFDIRAIHFDDEPAQVVIQYMHLPSDVRAKGHLVATHTLAIGDVEGWHNEIRDLRMAAQTLLADALEDFEESDPLDMEDVFSDIDPDELELGMGE